MKPAPLFSSVQERELKGGETVWYYFLKTVKECRLLGCTPDKLNGSLWAGVCEPDFKSTGKLGKHHPEDVSFLSLMKD